MFYRYAYTELILTLTADEPLGVLRALDGTQDAVTLSGPVVRTVLMTPLTREQWRGYTDLATMPDGAYLITGMAADDLGNEGTFSLPFEIVTLFAAADPRRTVIITGEVRGIALALELRQVSVSTADRAVFVPPETRTVAVLRPSGRVTVSYEERRVSV